MLYLYIFFVLLVSLDDRFLILLEMKIVGGGTDRAVTSAENGRAGKGGGQGMKGGGPAAPRAAATWRVVRMRMMGRYFRM